MSDIPHRSESQPGHHPSSQSDVHGGRNTDSCHITRRAEACETCRRRKTRCVPLAGFCCQYCRSKRPIITDKLFQPELAPRDQQSLESHTTEDTTSSYVLQRAANNELERIAEGILGFREERETNARSSSRQSRPQHSTMSTRLRESKLGMEMAELRLIKRSGGFNAGIIQEMALKATLRTSTGGGRPSSHLGRSRLDGAVRVVIVNESYLDGFAKRMGQYGMDYQSEEHWCWMAQFSQDKVAVLQLLLDEFGPFLLIDGFFITSEARNQRFTDSVWREVAVFAQQKRIPTVLIAKKGGGRVNDTRFHQNVSLGGLEHEVCLVRMERQDKLDVRTIQEQMEQRFLPSAPFPNISPAYPAQLLDIAEKLVESKIRRQISDQIYTKRGSALLMKRKTDTNRPFLQWMAISDHLRGFVGYSQRLNGEPPLDGRVLMAVDTLSDSTVGYINLSIITKSSVQRLQQLLRQGNPTSQNRDAAALRGTLAQIPESLSRESFEKLDEQQRLARKAEITNVKFNSRLLKLKQDYLLDEIQRRGPFLCVEGYCHEPGRDANGPHVLKHLLEFARDKGIHVMQFSEEEKPPPGLVSQPSLTVVVDSGAGAGGNGEEQRFSLYVHSNDGNRSSEMTAGQIVAALDAEFGCPVRATEEHTGGYAKLLHGGAPHWGSSRGAAAPR